MLASSIFILSCLFVELLIQFFPAVFWISSRHLFWGLPILLLYLERGVAILYDHLSMPCSEIFQLISIFIYFFAQIRFVLLLFFFGTLSRKLICSIALSIVLCETSRSLKILQVCTIVSRP